ncbi:TRAP transporter substrate-binding protein [Crenobacter sp. SG2303]|uniref:TRAP transporter substrate-binding protein n=1 Tax=Crenobacter oryzisoli TaxID=3056844 RepID=A0ABT7XQ95_9NEIS|nr:TRAP transporter substrate-binding protein [Crenobacter sp. SG2303]MDN0075974.1 TRAP transporter substrate-binding protein [Crenobacter sp. SG2303]
MPRKHILWASLVTVLLLVAGGWAWLSAHAERSPIVIKFSHVVAPDTPKGRAVEYFKQLAEQRSHGRVRVLVYPNSQLYKDKEELEALQLGSVQMLAPSLAKLSPLGVKEFEAFALPYLFDDYDAVHRVTQGRVGKLLFSRLEAKGIKGLAYWDNGFKHFSANRPIHVPADLQGLRIRIQSSRVAAEEMYALGAVPQVLAFADVYPALQAGVIDGTELDPSNFYTGQAYRVQKNLTLTGHEYLGYAVIVNKAFWDDLPSDVRSILEGALRDATVYENHIARQQNDAALAAVRAAGTTTVYQPTPAERAAFKQALLPVHARMADRIGRDLLQQIYQDTGFRATP